VSLRWLTQFGGGDRSRRSTAARCCSRESTSCARKYSMAALDVCRGRERRRFALPRSFFEALADLQHVLHLCALAQDTWAEATKLRRGKRYTVCNAVRTPAGQARRLSGCDWSRNSYGQGAVLWLVADLSARPQLRLAGRSILEDRENVTTVRAKRQWLNEHNSREVKIAI